MNKCEDDFIVFNKCIDIIKHNKCIYFGITCTACALNSTCRKIKNEMNTEQLIHNKYYYYKVSTRIFHKRLLKEVQNILYTFYEKNEIEESLMESLL